MASLLRISENKRSIAVWGLRGILILLILLEFPDPRWPIVYINILILGVSFFPSILKRIFSLSLPIRFEILFLSILVLAVTIEKLITGIIIELFLGMVYGVIGFIIMYIIYVNSKIKINFRLIMLFSFSFSVAIGAIWEVFRYYLFETIIPNAPSSSEFSTAKGLILTIAGATIISVLIYVYTRYLKGGFFLHLADDVIRSNPGLFSLSDQRMSDVTSIISKGENEQIEFKSTLRKNLHTGKIDKKIEYSTLKTIVAFLNTNGGTLLVGVTDDGCVKGIEEDGFENHDAYYRHFTNLFKKHIGTEYMSYVKTKVKKIQGKHVLIVECAVSQETVFLTIENKDYFYIRNGPASIELQGKDLISYVTKRF